MIQRSARGASTSSSTTKNARVVRVLIVDDSSLVRRALTELLEADARLSVMYAATDPFDAAQAIARELPDVMVLDIEMPRMDGITFLKKVMRQRPIPTVICSTLARPGSRSTFEAMKIGAVDVVQKPRLDGGELSSFLTKRLQDTVWAAAHADLSRTPLVPREGNPASETSASSRLTALGLHAGVIAIGASTGGTEALLVLLSQLPKQSPPIVVTQHMPEHFTASFANYLNESCELGVSEAKDGDDVIPGHVFVARGNHHLVVQRAGARLRLHLHDGPPVSRHRPSVDALFHSVAESVGRGAVGIILTGMGDDGADGLLAMKRAGAHTIAQDEDSCVVFGMPREAIERGAVDEVLSLNMIPGALRRIGHRDS